MSERAGFPEVQGAARCGVLRALSGAPARRLQLRLLPCGRPSRRRGPDRADLPAGLPPLRAGAARIAGAIAAAVADPDRAQPRGGPLPRLLAPARLAERAQPDSRGPPLRPGINRTAHTPGATLSRDRPPNPASPIDETTTIAAMH